MYYILYLDVTIPNSICQDCFIQFLCMGQKNLPHLSRRQLFNHCDHFVALGKTDLTLLVEYHSPCLEGEFFHIELGFF